jgi:type II secretory pathway component GspD/PulD (secretin)
MVMIELQIAELLPSSRDSQTTDSANDESAANETPDMEEDGAAWLAWAKKHGRLKTLCRPQIVTRDNQPAHLQIGSQVPTDPAATGAEKGKTTDPAFVGLIVKLVPRITPDGLVIMEINVEVSSIVKTNPPGNPLIASGTMQTILTAKDGQTITVSGPIQRREDGDSQLVVAVTPRINPQL